jgi:fermentation-respiration switch protein FrsA (DUF1100 family)
VSYGRFGWSNDGDGDASHADVVSALFTKTGPAILFTHSQGGGPGWLTAIKNPNVRAIVAFEPGSGFIVPNDELPAVMPGAAGTLSPEAVPLADFQKLAHIADQGLEFDMSDQVVNASRREFLGASALVLSGAVLGVRAMTNTTAAAATREENPFTLVYRGALMKNEPGKVNIHPVTDAQIAALPFEMYRQGYEYYWRTHAHPNSTFKYTMSSLLDLMRWDATDQIALIEQPLLMMAGSKADSRYMTEDAFAKAIGAKDKELFTIDGATHIETYWVPEYVDAAMGKLKPFFARTL